MISTVSPIVVVIGAVLAALIAGFFSFVNLVSAKESKVSEFRLSWIDGLREEIARFTASVHELVRIHEHKDELEVKDWLEITADPFRYARESLTAIQLRLNPKDVEKNPTSSEAKLMRQIQLIREAFLKDDYQYVVNGVDQVRILAAPLLKREWERVKVGELAFRRARSAAIFLLFLGMAFIAFAGYRATLNVEVQPQAAPIEPLLQQRPTMLSSERTTSDSEPDAKSAVDVPASESQLKIPADQTAPDTRF